MSKTQKQREVVELLKVYRDHHTPGGGSPDATLNLESMSGYESGFPIGARLGKLEKKLLTNSLKHLGHALTMLRADYYGAYSAISLAGLPAEVRFHDLRHTAGTHALRKGRPIHEVSKMLGHSDPDMTLRRYAHVLDDMRDDTAKAMDDLF